MTLLKQIFLIFCLIQLNSNYANCQVALNGKCGGIGYTGPTVCVTGLTCYAQSDYESQCLFSCPSGWKCPPDSTVPPGLDIYSACAGINYNGPAIDCMYGLKCFAKDAYYSQCLFTCPSGWECTVTSHSTVPSTNITTVSHNTSLTTTTKTSTISINSVYIGCYADNLNNNGVRALGAFYNRPIIFETNAIQNCVAICGVFYEYAGVELGNQCFCGNSYNKFGLAKQHGYACNTKCANNTNVMCGGVHAISVYKAQRPIELTKFNYIGCFADGFKGKISDLQGIKKESKKLMTKGKCISFCRAGHYLYAGLQNGNRCLCGNSYGSYGPATKKNHRTCNMACTGNKAQNCGGKNANAVYHTR